MMITMKTALLTASAAIAGCLALGGCTPGTSAADQHLTADYSYGSLPGPGSASPPPGDAAPHGRVRVAEAVGATPDWIFPLTPVANSSVYTIYQFQYLSWRPVFWSPRGSIPDWDWKRSMADGPPAVSNGGRTFTIHLNGRYTWSTGRPVTSHDVLFFYRLYKAAVGEDPANSGNYTPGQFPDNVVSATAPDDRTVVFTFDRVYNPSWVLGTEFSQLIPLPEREWSRASPGGPFLDTSDPRSGARRAQAVYDRLALRSRSLSSYGSDPLWKTVDGPYRIAGYNASTSAAVFRANPAYTGRGRPAIDELDLLSYTSPTSEFNDLLNGSLDFGYVSSDDFPQLGRLRRKGYHLYGKPEFGNFFIAFNFQDGRGGFAAAIKQLYVRQAMAHLVDQQGLIQGAYHGLAAPGYNVVPVSPRSPFAPGNALHNPYPYSPAEAARLLTGHGWRVVPGGTTRCVRPGTGAGECGSGVRSGQSLDFTFYYVDNPQAVAVSATAFASALKGIGVTATLRSDKFNNVLENESDASSPGNRDDWGMAYWGGESDSIYPSTVNLFNTGGSFNAGGFSDPGLDRLIEDSMLSPDPRALSRELAAVTAKIPVLFQPNPAMVYAWSPRLNGDPDGFAAATQYMLNPEDWYLR
jgi:peptide/nickel transport system substrate-binding protein